MACCPDDCEYIEIGKSYYVNVTAFRDYDGTYQNSATGTWTLYEKDDPTVSVASGSMSYLSASSGNYRGTITAAVTADLVENKFYLIKVVLTQSPNTLTLTMTREAVQPT